ncbi:MAG TPA: alpha/beta hydrolase, partial [Acidobacteriota bacterium]|nr:alpha/beta hydrolase [Acidobacteriota bacterium]
MIALVCALIVQTATAAPEIQKGYAPVNGLKIYFEIHGNNSQDQTPLILLHGGGSTIETSFGKILPILAKQRKIIAFEQQGHGHTADVDRPFT